MIQYMMPANTIQFKCITVEKQSNPNLIQRNIQKKKQEEGEEEEDQLV